MECDAPPVQRGKARGEEEECDEWKCRSPVFRQSKSPTKQENSHNNPTRHPQYRHTAFFFFYAQARKKKGAVVSIAIERVHEYFQILAEHTNSNTHTHTQTEKTKHVGRLSQRCSSLPSLESYLE
jgi:hypothetical protein